MFCYRSGPKGWMDGQVLCKRLTEARAIRALPGKQQRVLFVDNASSHNSNENVQNCLRDIYTTLQKFPPNAIHLLMPADSFIIR